jgi:hypothetical protein
VLSAAIGILEALLFGFLGRIIDRLSGMKAGNMWQQASRGLYVKLWVHQSGELLGRPEN